MQKSTLIIILIFGIVVSLILFMFVSLGILPLFYSSCAFFGIEKITGEELRALNLIDNEKIIELSKDDFKEVPKLLPLINKISNKVQFNESSIIVMNYSDMEQYHKFLDDKFVQEHGYTTLDYKKNIFSIEYNSKKYVVTGFVFPSSEFPVTDYVELYVSLNTGFYETEFELTDNDFMKIPKIKTSIEEIGTHEVKVYEHLGMSENEWNQYREWFDKQYSKGYSYFSYDGKIYSPSFGIC